MFELTINGQVYAFHFGMGFMREVNKRVGRPVDGLPNVKKNVGLRWLIAGVMDGDVEDLVDLLDTANKGQNPRVTKNLLDEYIDKECEDIDKLFDDVLGFLKTANATKKTVEALLAEMEAQKANQTQTQ